MMMQLVSSKEVVGAGWDAATVRHHDAFEAWSAFLNSPESLLDEPAPPIH